MDKNYNAFMERVKQTLVKEYGMDERKIYYKEVNGSNEVPQDRLAIIIGRNETHKATCSVRIGELYSRYVGGEDFRKLMETVADAVKDAECRQFFKKMNALLDYEKAKENLFIRLLNKDKNKDELKKAVYRTVGDVALVLYFKVEKYNGDILCMKVKPDYVRKWGIEEEKVLDAALYNTYRMTPPRIYLWEKLLFMENYRGEDFINPESGFRFRNNIAGNCLSTMERNCGAVAVFMPGVAERIGELLDDDFYVVFTSIHEAMIHSVKMAEPKSLAVLLKETQEACTPEELQLTNHIFRYNRKYRSFSMCER